MTESHNRTNDLPIETKFAYLLGMARGLIVSLEGNNIKVEPLVKEFVEQEIKAIYDNQ